MAHSVLSERLRGLADGSNRPASLPTPGQAFWNQRHQLAASAPRLRALIDAVGRPTDLSPFQWAQLFALTLEFEPDLIIELGRGWGNSTCCFLEAARVLRPWHLCKLLSLSLDDDWTVRTMPRLRGLATPDWLAAGEFLQTNILTYDFAPVLATSQRCLVFWDAHGFDVAECVLGRLLPLLADKTHIVAMHDLCDLRYCSPPREYGTCGLWKGENATEPAFWLGHIFSRVGQAISIVDFTTRNRLPLHSADESLHAELAADPVKRVELTEMLGNDLVSLVAHWFWFSLNEATEAITFPASGPPVTPPAGNPLAAAPPLPARPALWQRLLGRGRRLAKGWLNPTRQGTLAAGLTTLRTSTNQLATAAEPAPATAPHSGPPREVWLDIGAHRGEKTFAAAHADPGLCVYAFEPNWPEAAPLLGRLPNYVVLPFAVGETDGTAEFHRNRCSAASSLLQLDPAGVRAWRGGESLHVEQTLTVPTVRLDTFLQVMRLAKVHYLKIDAQGADLAVVRSLGARIADVERIELEVQTTPTPLYQRSARKAEVLEFMAQAGFVLRGAEPQSAGQEENLCFVRPARQAVAPAPRSPDVLPSSAAPAVDPACFDTPEALAINEARLDHLEGLGLNVRGRLLDVGCGVGQLGSYFAERGCAVVCVDGRAENIEALRRRHPELEAHVVDVERTPLQGLGRFDAVFCYGLLYHLENPLAALRNCAAVCDDLFLLESVVTDHPEPVLVLADETPAANQALDGLGCRPSPAYLVKALHHVGFPWVYAPEQPPAHPDFEFAWRHNLEHRRDGHLLRCVFVASRRPLANRPLRLLADGADELQGAPREGGLGPWTSTPAR